MIGHTMSEALYTLQTFLNIFKCTSLFFCLAMAQALVLGNMHMISRRCDPDVLFCCLCAEEVQHNMVNAHVQSNAHNKYINWMHSTFPYGSVFVDGEAIPCIDICRKTGCCMWDIAFPIPVSWGPPHQFAWVKHKAAYYCKFCWKIIIQKEREVFCW